MNIEILDKKENNLLHRTEIKFKVVHNREKTPTRDAIRKVLADNMNTKIDTVIIDSVKTQFGKEEVIVYGKIYDNVENAKKIEPDYILLRHKLIEKKS